MRTSWDRSSLYVDHSLRSGMMLLHVGWLGLLLISSPASLLQRSLFLVAMFSYNRGVLPLLLS